CLMDREPTISLVAYYAAAISRAFWAAWDLALGQGLLLTILLGVGALVCASGYAMIRAWRRSHPWQAQVGQAFIDFLIAGVGAVVIMLALLFGWFFIQDAPHQIAQRDARIAALGGAPDTPISLPLVSKEEA